MGPGHGEPVLVFEGVCLHFGGPPVLRDIDWTVRRGERWVVLGPNGSGKTSLLRLASGYLHPTAGRVRILGRTLGRVDVRELRRRIGIASSAVSAMLRPTEAVLDAVMAARHGALETWWHTYSDADRQRALSLLELMGCAHLAGRPVGTVSDGERQRIGLARTLMADPELLLLDEPTAGLDLGGREALVAGLAALADDGAAPTVVLVTHHLEEIPPGFGHVLLLRDGRTVAAGPIAATLTEANLEAVFGLPVALDRRGDRWIAFGAATPTREIRDGLV
jgi:iron complex transport system ATP-binding protein